MECGHVIVDGIFICWDVSGLPLFETAKEYESVGMDVVFGVTLYSTQCIQFHHHHHIVVGISSITSSILCVRLPIQVFV